MKTELFNTVNWKLLREQKLWLLAQAPEHPQADGLIHLLDVIQDEAVACGDATELEVFGPPPRRRRVRQTVKDEVAVNESSL